MNASGIPAQVLTFADHIWSACLHKYQNIDKNRPQRGRMFIAKSAKKETIRLRLESNKFYY
jgi:hypothetical protein